MWQNLSPLQGKAYALLIQTTFLHSTLTLISSFIKSQPVGHSLFKSSELKDTKQAHCSITCLCFFPLNTFPLFGMFSCSCTHHIQFITVSTGAKSAMDFTLWFFSFLSEFTFNQLKKQGSVELSVIRLQSAPSCCSAQHTDNGEKNPKTNH